MAAERVVLRRRHSVELKALVLECPDLMNSHTQIGGDHLDNKRDEIETKSL